MKHLSSIVLAAVVLAAGAVACFKDPTSSLRNGPTRVVLTRSAVDLRTGDSLQVQGEVKDEQGNTFDATDAVWASSDATIAAVHVDTSTSIPYNAVSRAFVVGVAAAGGVTTVSFTSHGVTNQMRVVVLPVRYTALATTVLTGTAVPDTILITTLGVTTQDVLSAKDTVTISIAAGSNLTFDAAASTVSFGSKKAKILSRSATSIKVMAGGGPFHGRPWVTKLTWAGPADVGNLAIDSLQGDTMAVARPRFHGTVGVSSGIVMTIVPPAGLAFRTASPATEVWLHGLKASIITRTASQLIVSDTAVADSAPGYTGGVVISNTDYTTTANGVVRFDSLWTTSASTIRRVSFPGTISTPARLMDTIRVVAPGLLNAATSNVVVGGQNAWIIVRTADSIRAIAKLPGQVSVTNVTTGGVTFPSLAPARTITVPDTPTGAANEPGNNSRATATVVDLTGTTAASPLAVLGVMDANDAADSWDYYTFTLAAPQTVTATLNWFGNGGGATTANPDFDVIICGPAPVTACSYGQDLSGSVAAGTSQPETFTVDLAAGQYYVRTYAYATAGPVVYQLVLHLP